MMAEITEATLDEWERLADFVDGIKLEQTKSRGALITEVEKLRAALEEIADWSVTWIAAGVIEAPADVARATLEAK